MNIEDAVYQTVHSKEHGGAPALAVRMGKSPNVLNSKANPNIDTHHMRLDEVVSIIELTNDYRIMDAMAQRLGGVFTKLEESEDDSNILISVLNLTSGTGDLAHTVKEATSDNNIDDKEEQELLEIVGQLHKLLQGFSMKVRRSRNDR